MKITGFKGKDIDIKTLLSGLTKICIVVVVILIIIQLGGGFDEGKETIITSSTLTDTVNVAELSTAQFTYNGIAEIYKDKEKKKVNYYIRYNAKIKAGVDMSEIQWKIDHENRTVKPILPQITINVNTVDEKTLSFIPENATIELNKALAACKEDSKSEALKSTGLLETAKDNLKSIVEGLLYQILTSQNYKIIWE